MKTKTLIAIALATPAIALACAKPGKPAADPPEQQPASATSACCRLATCDEQGRIVRRDNGNGSFTEFIYHPRSGKLILVLNDNHRTTYHYDGQGKLEHAGNSDGKSIRFEYRGSEKIQRMVQVDRHTGEQRDLAFKYNAAGKPVEIALAGVGKLTVEYDGAGEIKHVHTKHGAKMALQIHHAFLELSAITRPTGMRF